MYVSSCNNHVIISCSTKSLSQMFLSELYVFFMLIRKIQTGFFYYLHFLSEMNLDYFKI
jgi:hypothetical protein